MQTRGAIWAVAGPLLAFKLWAAVLLLVFAPNRDGLLALAATQWPFVLLAVVLVLGPALARWRLLRVRARREQLRRAEWMLDRPPQRLPETGLDLAHRSLWETVSRLERES